MFIYFQGQFTYLTLLYIITIKWKKLTCALCANVKKIKCKNIILEIVRLTFKKFKSLFSNEKLNLFFIFLF